VLNVWHHDLKQEGTLGVQHLTHGCSGSNNSNASAIC
jgi:hypothetical protein